MDLELKWLVVMEHYGQYTILGRIGEGAHGIVFKAKHIEVRLLQLSLLQLSLKYAYTYILILLCLYY